MLRADDGTIAAVMGHNAVCHQIFHFGVALLVQQSLCRSLLDHCHSHTMWEMLLQACSRGQYLIPFKAVEADHIGNLRAGIGQSTGFVKYNGIRLSKRLQILAALDGSTILRSLPHRRDHGNGGGQLDGTGEIHHQHRQCLGQIAAEQPDQSESQKAVGYNGVRQMLCLALHPCLQIFGFIDQTDNLVEPGIRRKASDLYHKGSCFHRSAGKHAVPGLFMYRFGFAGHGGLVHHTLLIADCSVKGDYAARPDNDLISHLHPVKGHLDAVRSAAKPYTVHIQRQLLGQCKPGTLFGVRLQPVGSASRNMTEEAVLKCP